ncbi:hypothetical protein [Actinomadura oligospora]|uniref:hypothetical protein n=1 Tax=Actinomadura oligospora TaxID=111804 RepID=UPI00047CE25A|nr:hypothetical protein [Actinomadura oligospora]
MAVAALIVWLLTALGGFTMLGLWLARGGMRAPADAPPTRFPVPVIFGHLLLAVAGLIIWIIYMATDATALAWIALILLVVIALLGFTMLTRWLPTHRAARTETGPPERAIPLPVVVAHGLLAVATLVLVLIATVSE